MKITVRDEEEKKALTKIMRRIDNLLASMPTYRGDFVEPDNALEKVLMWKVLDTKLIETHPHEKAISDQFPDEYQEYSDDEDA